MSASAQASAERSVDPGLDVQMLDEEVLDAIATGLAAVTPPWQLDGSAGDEQPSERRYTRLLVTPTYEAWLILWPAGTGLDAHDHGGSAGAFSVIAGELDETALADGHVTVRRLGPGQTSSFGPEHVHAVVNRGAQAATSVHVYSPPLASMEFFTPGDDGSLLATGIDAGGWTDVL